MTGTGGNYALTLALIAVTILFVAAIVVLVNAGRKRVR